MANDAPHNMASERRMTTDPGRIREWAETRNAVPVTVHGGEGHGFSFARRDEIGDEHDEYTWDEFAEAFEDENLVFVYHEEAEATGEGLGSFELLERERAFERADLGRDELEDSLRRGETVTTEIVETQVIEREIVERDTIESEVVESNIAERNLVDSERLSREVVETEFLDDETIEVVVDETRLDTVEEIERYTVESRVVDVDVEQHDELERDEIETNIELESVQRSILESDVVRSDVTPDDVLEQEAIRSNRTEGDTVQSELIERRTIEEEIDERRRLRFVLEERELVSSEVIRSDMLEGEIIDIEEYGAAEPTAAEAGAETDVPAESAESDMDVAAGGAESEMETAESTETVNAEAGAAMDESAIELSADDQGKDVVDERGETVGIVAEVEGQTAYIDPQPGLTDRLKARLNWGGHGDDDYPVEAAQISDITDDEIVLRGE
ncbi:hypothetical protein CV102_15115 [Natronococcus pandeyae]|uniref:DUF2382 domain-containing protein n=1 Tax=Natronococcus pandeyae TaxID=2055836 RepID=A0A8J8Q3A5_9EURY|nr:hypothetical protein [Natronococcus pandeyae]TYL37668.1 hypothetical protein CV102_15115 [Natronococcus pandeyae]